MKIRREHTALTAYERPCRRLSLDERPDLLRAEDLVDRAVTGERERGRSYAVRLRVVRRLRLLAVHQLPREAEEEAAELDYLAVRGAEVLLPARGDASHRLLNCEVLLAEARDAGEGLRALVLAVEAIHVADVVHRHV